MSHDSLGSFLLLRHSDSAAAQGSKNQDASQIFVVLLHGWLQNSEAWLGLAQRLRERRADVLLIDFYAHGHSPVLPKTQMHSVAALATQVERIVAHVGWHERSLVIGGMSMGASVALRYAARHRNLVSGLLLVAPSGMPEPIVSVARVGQALAKILLGPEDVVLEHSLVDESAIMLQETGTPGELPGSPVHASLRQTPSQGEIEELTLPALGVGPFAKRMLARLNLIKRTPLYDVCAADFAAVRESAWPVTLVLGRYDVVHTPHVKDWQREVPRARILMARATHWWLCTGIATLTLENDPFWEQALQYQLRFPKRSMNPLVQATSRL